MVYGKSIYSNGRCIRHCVPKGERGLATICKMGDVGGWEFELLKLPLLTTAACRLAAEETVGRHVELLAMLFKRSMLSE